MKAKMIGSLMVLIAGAAPVSAFPCRQQVVVQKVVVEKQIEVVVPVVEYIRVPVYGLTAYPSYAPPQAYTAPAPADDPIRELVAEFKALRGEIQALRAGPNARVEAPKVDPKLDASAAAVVTALRKGCAQCHNQASASIDGGGLMLFKSDGSFQPLTEDMAKRLHRRVARGSMPPPPAKLDDADKKILLEAFK